MNILHKISATVLVALMSVATLPFIAFSAESDVQVDVVVRGETTIGVANATVTLYAWNETGAVFEMYGETAVTNSSGRANNMPVPQGATFYAEAVGEGGEVYGRSGFDYSNTWLALSEDNIQNVETGSTRLAFMHLYPGANVAVIDETLTEVIAGSDTEVETSDATETSVEVIRAESIELEATVFDAERNPIVGAEVFVYVTGVGLYGESRITGGAGRTDGLMIPVGYEFYAVAYADGVTYGGTYDYYFERQNLWSSPDGETIENADTGTTRLPYLHLFPKVMTPTAYTGAEADFEAETYRCGGFPDAAYADLTHEECEAIDYVKAESIFTGTGEGTIELNRPINRAEVTKVMLEAYNRTLLEDTSSVKRFPDVAEWEWYHRYVYSARSHAIVDGYPDGLFRPSNTINRVELLRIFLEASSTSLVSIPTTFTFWHDVEVNAGTQWFIGYANHAFMNDLLNNEGNLKPAEAMTRLDVILLLYRAIK